MPSYWKIEGYCQPNCSADLKPVCAASIIDRLAASSIEIQGTDGFQNRLLNLNRRNISVLEQRSDLVQDYRLFAILFSLCLALNDRKG